MCLWSLRTCYEKKEKLNLQLKILPLFLLITSHVALDFSWDRTTPSFSSGNFSCRHLILMVSQYIKFQKFDTTEARISHKQYLLSQHFSPITLLTLTLLSAQADLQSRHWLSTATTRQPKLASSSNLA